MVHWRRHGLEIPENSARDSSCLFLLLPPPPPPPPVVWVVGCCFVVGFEAWRRVSKPEKSIHSRRRRRPRGRFAVAAVPHADAIPGLAGKSRQRFFEI